jgi:23S rRNA (uracil1939-C5)-methyltransferase
MSEVVEIVALGHAGDGLTADGTFVPLTVPGDRVRIARKEGRGRLLDIVTPGPSRAIPPCPHFGTCGGCTLQHLDHATYAAFKHEAVRTALAQRGFDDVAVEPVRTISPGTRRRAGLKARGTGRGCALGFYARDSRDLVPIAACPVLSPPLVAILAPLREAMADLLGRNELCELHLTATDGGVDLSLRLKRTRSAALLMDLAELAAKLRLARLTWNGEPLCTETAPFVRIGDFAVALPPECFLQPTREGEAVLQALVREGVGGASRIADLFAGCGTFALALAEGRMVHAVEGEAAMLAALMEAAAGGGARVSGETRDLFRRPLTAPELSRFDAVVIDPPRPGARSQSAELARSSVATIVYVSCSPASFARDARLLADGGYRLVRVVPVDQFLWSAHVELVGVLKRDS